MENDFVTQTASDEQGQDAYRSVIKPLEQPAVSYDSVVKPPSNAPVQVQAIEAPKPVLSERTRLGFGVLGVAVLAGVSGDALLRETPWGLNLLVWTLLMTGAAGCLLHWRQRRGGADLLGEGKWLVIPLLFFAACLAWRDSATLNALALFALVLARVLMAFRARTGKLLLAGLTEYCAAGAYSFGQTLSGFGRLLFGDIVWRELPGTGWKKSVKAGAQGLAIATPLLLLFGGLLVAADAAFEELVSAIFNFDVWRIALHLFTTVGIAWLVTGFLRSLVFAQQPRAETGQRGRGPALGIIQIAVPLALLNLLFLAFVVVQFRYLFFAASDFRPGAGLAYALYARRGFFELVAVSVLVLPLLLGAHWLLSKNKRRDELIFRVLAGTQIALLFVIMASAVQRMRLYQMCCGLTELRYYTIAFMGWLALVFVWFALTVLRGQRARFAFGAVVAGFGVIALLHALNPDDRIARVNLLRAKEGRSVDLHYTVSLSADAVPALVAGLPQLKDVDPKLWEAVPMLKDVDRGLLAARVQNRWLYAKPADWRSWNWSRATAQRAVLEESFRQKGAQQ